MTNDELMAQFTRCERWQDAEQWDLLGLAYYNNGYFLNALCCFEKADACRNPPPALPVLKGSAFIVSTETIA